MTARILRGLGALVLLAGIVLGAPVLLLRWGVIPSFSWLWLTGRDDGTLLLGLLTLVAWLAWGWFTFTVVLETAAQLAGRRWRLPGFGWSRTLVAGLVVAVLTMLSQPGAQALPGAAHPLAGQPLTDQPRTDQPRIEQPRPDQPRAQEPRAQEPRTLDPDGSSSHGQPRPAPTRAGPAAQVLADPDLVHVVERGDDLWSLAEHYYGSGTEWRRIAAANPDLLTGGPDDLIAGWKLTIPGVATSPAGSVVVRAGDTLSALAREHLGSAGRWREILAVNRHLIADPDQLAVGMVLELPGSSQQDGDRHRDRRVGESDDQDAGSHDDEDSTEQDNTDEKPRDEPVDRPDRAEPSEQQPSAESTGAPAPHTEDEASVVDAVLPGVGALLAAGLVAAFALRRRVQLALRPVGRRIPVPDAQIQRIEQALGQREDPRALEQLDRALRVIHRHCEAEGAAVPALATATVGPDGITFAFRVPAKLPPPPGFAGDQQAWRLAPQTSLPDASASEPAAWPALACLGQRDLDHVLIDLAGTGRLFVDAATPELAHGTLSALLMELGCAWWTDHAQITLVGRADEFVAVAGSGSLGYVADPERGVRQVEQAVYGGDGAQVFVFDADLGPALGRRIQQLELADSGVGVVLLQGVAGVQPDARLVVEERAWPVGPTARLEGAVTAGEFTPQLVSEALRTQIIELFEATGGAETEAAPWWAGETGAGGETGIEGESGGDREWGADGERGDEVETRTSAGTGTGAEPEQTPPVRPRRAAAASSMAPVVPLPGAAGPVLRLLGPLELVGCRGVPPSRAERQCVEYCAWLLEHPGASSRAMADALVVAEATRRSNVSRLRSWLGEDEDGEPYLPDAWSGGLRLHPSVTSDWQRVRSLLRPGVDQAGDAALVAALELVRGAPFADAAPGQWGWAEGLRVDIISLVRDAAVVLARRALSAGDVDQVRWATARGLAAAPGDEHLLLSRLEAEHRVGNRREVSRLSRLIVERARNLDVPLSPATIRTLQEVLEGQRRAVAVGQTLTR